MEEFVCAWIVEMDLGEIYEFGNAYCNRDDNVVKPRTNEDMANSLVLTANNPNSDLYADLSEIDEKDEERDNKVNDVLENKLKVDYQLDMRTIPAVIRIFFDSEGHHYTPDMKPYTSPSIIAHGLLVLKKSGNHIVKILEQTFTKKIMLFLLF